MTDSAEEGASLADMLAQFGEVEIASLPKFGRIAANRLAESWPKTPQVTHHDEADVTELEAGRKAVAASGGPRITALPYIVKAAVASLKAFPTFNGAFDPTTGKVILRRYYNIGVAIDTPNGLLVGVIRQCDVKSVAEISDELAALSDKARAKGLSYDEVTGGGFTVSSLGGLGGTAFTPIVNPPEVAILGLSRVRETAFRGENDTIRWRLMAPLSLSYDHRVINGADAARFVSHLRAEIESLRPSAT